MSTNYQRGSTLEQRVMTGMKAAGHLAMRSAGSKGLVDVLVIRAHGGWPHVQLISCKRGKGGAPPSERIQLREMADKLIETRPMPVLAWQRASRKPIEWYAIGPGGELQRIGDLL